MWVPPWDAVGGRHRGWVKWSERCTRRLAAGVGPVGGDKFVGHRVGRRTSCLMKYAVSMARSYVQQARAAAAESKRQDLLDAAISMLAEEPLPRVTLDAVAKRAGAARSTVYVMFGSRAGL